MSIRVQNLTKVYDAQVAVNNISFEIGEGEIVGFLGPNGAGKSTTMKIITGFIPPTSGLVDVCLFDVLSRPGKVKSVIGYLPENNPLYTEMYVHEYLRFVGSLYRMKGSQLTKRVDQIVEMCGLKQEQNKKIEALSRGYRQRVGLGQALLHDPKVLILDEPTTGLDPNQLAEIRSLIRDIGLNKTVLFSTHIMQEVEAICDRVIVINKGSIVADDSLENIMKVRGGEETVIVEFDSDVDGAVFATMPGVREVVRRSPRSYELKTSDSRELRATILRFAADQNLSLASLKQGSNTLESVFQELTR